MSRRPEQPAGIIARAPRDPAFFAEGWERYGRGGHACATGGCGDHPPSWRSICVMPTGDTWDVAVTSHDEHGNPIGNLCRCNGACDACRAAAALLGPFKLLGEALRVARAVRRSIVADLPDVGAGRSRSRYSRDGGRVVSGPVPCSQHSNVSRRRAAFRSGRPLDVVT